MHRGRRGNVRYGALASLALDYRERVRFSGAL